MLITIVQAQTDLNATVTPREVQILCQHFNYQKGPTAVQRVLFAGRTLDNDDLVGLIVVEAADRD